MSETVAIVLCVVRLVEDLDGIAQVFDAYPVDGDPAVVAFALRVAKAYKRCHDQIRGWLR